MTRIELRDYLQEIHENGKEIERLKHKISVLRDCSEHITPAYGTEAVVHTSAKQPMEEKIVELVDLETVLKEMTVSHEERRQQAVRAFSCLSSPECERLMLSRYIGGKSWTAISKEMERPIGTVRRWDREALDELLRKGYFSK